MRPSDTTPRPNRGSPALTDRIMVELLGGATWTEAAANAGCSRATVARRCADPGFRERLAAERRDRLARLTDKLTAQSVEMVDTLVEIARDTSQPPASRVRAAVSVLQLAATARQETDLEARLAALEHAAFPPQSDPR